MSTSSDNENLIVDAGDASRRLQISLREGVGGRDDVARFDIQFNAAALSIYYPVFMTAYLAQTNSGEDIPNPARSRTARRVAPFARFFLAGLLFLNLSFVAQAGWLQPAPDFSNYDVPLYEQIHKPH